MKTKLNKKVINTIDIYRIQRIGKRDICIEYNDGRFEPQLAIKFFMIPFIRELYLFKEKIKIKLVKRKENQDGTRSKD